MSLNDTAKDLGEVLELLQQSEAREIMLSGQVEFFQRAAEDWQRRHGECEQQFAEHVKESFAITKKLRTEIEQWVLSQRQCLLHLGLALAFVKGFLEASVRAETFFPLLTDKSNFDSLIRNVQGWVDTMPVPLLEGILKANAQVKEFEHMNLASALAALGMSTPVPATPSQS